MYRLQLINKNEKAEKIEHKKRRVNNREYHSAFFLFYAAFVFCVSAVMDNAEITFLFNLCINKVASIQDKPSARIKVIQTVHILLAEF